MTLGLDPRQHDKLGQVIRRDDANDPASARPDPGTRPSSNTDNGFVGVPASVITAKQQVSGSATLGSGSVWVYRVSNTGVLQEWRDPRNQAHQTLQVFNSTETVFNPSGTSNKIEEGTPILQLDQLRDSNFAVSPFGQQSTTVTTLQSFLFDWFERFLLDWGPRDLRA